MELVSVVYPVRMDGLKQALPSPRASALCTTFANAGHVAFARHRRRRRLGSPWRARHGGLALPCRNVAGPHGVHAPRSTAFEELGTETPRAKQLRRWCNAGGLRRIAAADRRAGQTPQTSALATLAAHCQPQTLGLIREFRYWVPGEPAFIRAISR